MKLLKSHLLSKVGTPLAVHFCKLQQIWKKSYEDGILFVWFNPLGIAGLWQKRFQICENRKKFFTLRLQENQKDKVLFLVSTLANF